LTLGLIRALDMTPVMSDDEIQYVSYVTLYVISHDFILVWLNIKA